MIALLLLSMMGAAAVAVSSGLFEESEDTTAATEQEINDQIAEADLARDLSLLEESDITELEAALRDDPMLALDTEASEDEQLLPYQDTNNFASVEGTEGADLIAIPEELGDGADAVFADAGDDVVLGNSAYNPIFGEAGDDLVFGMGGDDYLFGNEGDDTVAGGEGDDLLVGGDGSDLLYGGAGNDNIYDSRYQASYADENRADVIVAGEGDDGVVIEDGINLVSLGEGADHVQVYTESGDTPCAVITDFNPGEDSLLLGVYAPGVDLPDGQNALEISYKLSPIETELGPGTLIEPSLPETMAPFEMSDDTSVGYAVVLGLRPEDLQGADIRVVLQTDETDAYAPGGNRRSGRRAGRNAAIGSPRPA
ncbi:MAG: hypothetical protein IE922_07825 [Sphingomonadales bacterium]|nr:hypothetical protein [Sphingomonadales bacterium]